MIRKIIPLLLSITLVATPLYAEPATTDIDEPPKTVEKEQGLMDSFLDLSRNALEDVVGEIKEEVDQSRLKREVAAKEKPIYLNRYDDIVKHLDLSIEREQKSDSFFQSLKSDSDNQYTLKIKFRNQTDRPIIIQGMELERNLLLIDQEGFAYPANYPIAQLKDFEIYRKSARQLIIPFQYSGEAVRSIRLFNEDIPLE